MTSQTQVWIVDDDQSIRWVLERALQIADLSTRVFSNANDVLDAIQYEQPTVVISDIRMPGKDGFELLSSIHERYPDLPVIITTAHSDLTSAVTAYQGGAFEYLPKPFDIDEVVAVTQRALLHKPEGSSGQESPFDPPRALIGEAPAMQEVFRIIGRLSHSSITVLINGQSGTGKELVARALHDHSPRAAKPFIALNMAAIPKELIESELFGHEKGAFTGAAQVRKGRFEQAEGGTLFLDEIGDMPMETQTRLLRVLADGEYYRVGGHTPLKADVRIIAATHQDLENLATENRFREDLYHRLNVIRIQLPNLEERREDIPALAKHFLVKAANELDVEPKSLGKPAESKLRSSAWPGNVRQLENLCRRLTVMAPGKEIRLEDLPNDQSASSSPSAAVAGDWRDQLRSWAKQKLRDGNIDILTEAVREVETILLDSALDHTHGKKQEAARLLGWGRNTLTRKLKELEG